MSKLTFELCDRLPGGVVIMGVGCLPTIDAHDLFLLPHAVVCGLMGVISIARGGGDCEVGGTESNVLVLVEV